MPKIIARNATACLANCGEMGFWVILRMENGKRIRLFAGGSLDKGMRAFNWYRKEV